MIDDKILKALQTAVIAAVAASSNPSLPIKSVAMTLDGTPANYLEIVFIPNNITDEFWGEEKTYRGIMRLLLHWNMDKKGAYAPMKLLKSICAGLPKGSIFTHDGENVKLTDNPNLLSVIEQAPETLFPVSIRYQLFKA